ncbi:MAG: HEAT repeat domain-containing protein [Candidatus Helarchaeota archaeon]
MKKTSFLVLVYCVVVLGIIISLYFMLIGSVTNPFIFSSWTDFLIFVCLIYPFITLAFSAFFYFKLQHATPLVFSGISFLFFQGIWVRYPIISVFFSSAYFLGGMLLIGLGLWFESDLLPQRYPEAFKEKEEKPEPIDIELTEEDYKDEVKFWVKILGSSDNKFREEAIISLGEIGDTRAIPHLKKLLDDKSKSIRVLSMKNIKKITKSNE